MRKIGKKLRAEAIEFAGFMATFWASVEAWGPGDNFSKAARALALAAWRVAEWHDDDGTKGAVNRWAEAQAMLLEGWCPS